MIESHPGLLKKFIVHYTGNRNNLEPLIISEEAQDLDGDTSLLIQEGLLARFKNIHEFHRFHHPENLSFQETYQYCKQIFNNADEFEKVSASLARHLYAQSNHPRIKAGEFFLAYFEGLSVEGRNHKAIGMFRAEHRTSFLETSTTQTSVSFELAEGTELGKLDKGCLVVNRAEEEGYDVLVFDQQSRGEEAIYWKELFLGLTPRQDEFHHTNQILTLTRQFITTHQENDQQIAKTDQATLLHKSLDYFKTHESFDIEEFQKNVFESDEMIDSFRKYGSHYVSQNNYDISANFDIDLEAVKKQNRVYKNVLKLDKNFHIYIHGRTDLIERGIDEQGRKYYKIYYQEEA